MKAALIISDAAFSIGANVANKIKNTHALLLMPLFLSGMSLAVAEDVPTRASKTDKLHCGEQPKRLPKSPKLINFCECLPGKYRWESFAGMAGEVSVQFDVDADGTLTSTRLLKSSRFRSLDRHVLLAVSKCRFEPAYEDGKAIKSTLIQRYLIDDSDQLDGKGHGLHVENGIAK